MQALGSDGRAWPRSRRLRRAHRRHPSGLRASTAVEDFVEPERTGPRIVAGKARLSTVVIDACDQVRAKAVLAAMVARDAACRSSIAGAAGGKRQSAARSQVEDLADRSPTTRCWPRCGSACASQHGAARADRQDGTGLCVFSREPVKHRADASACEIGGETDGSAELPRLRLQRRP